MTLKIISKTKLPPSQTYDIHNFSEGLEDGNFIIDGKIVHNSILANGVRSFYDLMLLNAMGHPGPMQCCWSHSKILTERGLIEIKDLEQDRMPAITCLDNKGQVKQTTKYTVVSSGHKPLLKIKLKDGREIYVTKEHKILTKDQGYVEAANLRAGQNIRVYKASEDDPQ
jgi:hypothetical protein